MADDIGSLLGNAGERPVIEHDGKQYKFQAITQKVKSAFEQWLKGKARDQLAEDAKTMPPEMFGAAYNAYQRDIAKRKYRFGGEIYNEALMSPDGATQMISILTGCTPEEAEALMFAKQKEVTLVFTELMIESMPLPPEMAEQMRTAARQRLAESASLMPGLIGD